MCAFMVELKRFFKYNITLLMPPILEGFISFEITLYLGICSVL
jgi:hypothetical protein